MKKLFFVYGSLKSGFWNNSVLKDSVMVSEAVTKDKYLLTDVGFPYMIPENTHTEAVGHPTLPVMGEVYEVTSESVEASLDLLEGRGSHYDRKTISVVNEDNEEFEVQTYVPVDTYRASQYPVCDVLIADDNLCYNW